MKKAILSAVLAVVMLLLLVGGGLRTDGAGPGPDRESASAYMNTMTYDGGERIYYLSQEGEAGATIKYIDKETGEVGVLCGTEGCAHDDESCNARCQGDIALGINVSGAYLYWLEMSGGTARLCRMDIDGTEKAAVREIGSDVIPATLADPCVQVREGVLYLGAGTGDEGATRVFVSAIPLDESGEDTVIYQKDTADGYGTVAMLPVGDGLYIACSAQEQTEVAKYSTADKQLDTLTEEALPFACRYMGVSEEDILLATENAAHWFDQETGQASEAALCADMPEGGSAELTNDLVISWLREQDAPALRFTVSGFDGQSRGAGTIEFSQMGGGEFYSRRLLGEDGQSVYYMFTDRDSGSEYIAAIGIDSGEAELLGQEP